MTNRVKSLAEINESSANVMVDGYVKKYGNLLNVYESMSTKARIGESLSPYELTALGQQLDQFANYQRFCESQGSLASLGAVPQVALDVITASVGASILPLLASIQPIPEEHGIIWFKQMRPTKTAGGYEKDKTIFDPLTLDNPGDGTYGNNKKTLELSASVTTDTITGTLGEKAIRPYRFEVMLEDGSAFGKDDGNGKILGYGLSGTVDYKTGAYEIKLKAAPGTATKAVAIVELDVDAQEEINSIQANLISQDIKAQIWALKSDVGAFSSYAFAQRFGRSASDEVAQDLTDELTRELNTAAVMAILRSAPDTGHVEFSRTAPSGVSYAEHKLTFIDTIAQAEQQLHKQSGANGANRYIVGSTAAAVLRGMPGWESAPDAATVSVGLYGYYDGVPVIRATNVVPDDTMLCVANAGNYFNAPLVYAPYMPLMITSTVQNPNNPFRNTTAAGLWAGLQAVNTNLTTTIKVKG